MKKNKTRSLWKLIGYEKDGIIETYTHVMSGSTQPLIKIITKIGDSVSTDLQVMTGKSTTGLLQDLSKTKWEE